MAREMIQFFFKKNPAGMALLRQQAGATFFICWNAEKDGDLPNVTQQVRTEVLKGAVPAQSRGCWAGQAAGAVPWGRLGGS